MPATYRWALFSFALLAPAAHHASAVTVPVRVSVENLAPANSIAFAPLRLGISNGTFDSFNVGQAAGAPIISVAEGGSGVDWFPAFAAAEPTAVTGTVVPNPPGPLLPGASGTAVFNVDPAVNPFFTFGSMVVPSNDFFIGNDSPTQYRVLNADGTLNLTSILQRASDIWDAGSEAEIPANAAFVLGGNNDLRSPENGVVAFNFTELAAVFDGQTTGAGYTFNSQLTAGTDVYRITFAIVPEPTLVGVLSPTALMLLRRRFRR